MATLYLNGHDTEARLVRKRVEVTRVDPQADDVKTLYAPLFDIERVVVVGRAEMTTPLLLALARSGIPVHFCSGGGRWIGTLVPRVNGHALRRLRQYDLARDREFALDVARRLIFAKIRNCRRVLQRLAANRSESADPDQIEAIDTLARLAAQAENADSLDLLRGYEGFAGAVYFRRLGAFFPEEFPFNGRSRRPPRDAANALMSWTYTIVLTEIDTAVRTAELDPCLGFLHEISAGRPSLSLDLLEPLRAPLCDMLVLRLVNHKLVKQHYFETRDDGGVYLNDEGRKVFFMYYEETMQRRFAPTKFAAHTDFRGVIREQVYSLMRAMERKSDPAFFLMP